MPATNHLIALLVGAVATAGCADEFDPYEDVRSPRLLAVAADPPLLSPGDSATMTALSTAPAAAYRWSWCPLVGSSNDGYPCLITRAEVQVAVDSALGAGQVTVPDYDLGTGDSATLEHAVPGEVWRGFCDLLQSDDLPGPVAFPSCEGGFDVTVLLELDLGPTTVTAVREVTLLYDDQAPTNQIPALGGLVAIDPDGGASIPLTEGADAELRRGVEYQLQVELDDSQAESYQAMPLEGGPAETVREILRLSWFHEGGELDRSATSFNLTTPLAEARENAWTTPTVDDWDRATSRLFVVVRDDRGGTSWIERSVRWAE